MTSRAELGESGVPTGVWLEELAMPYRLCAEAGCEIRFATPEGRPAPLDPQSLVAPSLWPAGQWFLDQPGLSRMLETPVDMRTVEAESFDGLYLVGGTGTLWDFPRSHALGALVSDLHASGKPVAAICHGVAGLLAAHAPDGSHFVRGKRLTAFSNAEEIEAGCDAFVPILVETALVEQGAFYRASPPFQPMVVVDGLLVTGQNPASAPELSEKLLQLLR